jgi:hypothetical protein
MRGFGGLELFLLYLIGYAFSCTNLIVTKGASAEGYPMFTFVFVVFFGDLVVVVIMQILIIFMGNCISILLQIMSQGI